MEARILNRDSSMKIITTALYSFIIEQALWILNTPRFNWSLSYTHPHLQLKHWAE